MAAENTFCGWAINNIHRLPPVDNQQLAGMSHHLVLLPAYALMALLYQIQMWLLKID